MGYLQDKARKNKKIRLAVFFVIIVTLLFYFRTPVSRGLYAMGATIFRPVA